MKSPRGVAVAATLPPRGVAVAAAVLVLAALGPPAARATDVTTVQLRALAAHAARGNPVAMSQLRAVTGVDGRPAALGALLRGATPAQARARALVLAAPATTTPVAPDRSRALAASILAESRYGKTTIPDPLTSALNAVGRWLASLAAQTPGGPPVFWIAAAVLVLVLAAAGARRGLARREGDRSAPARGGEGREDDPAALEAAAREAERAGAYDEAVRLRFRAGLLALGSRSAIDYRPSLLSADVARRLDSREFEAVNGAFERIAYGGAEAEPDDAEAARVGWTEILARAGDRGQ